MRWEERLLAVFDDLEQQAEGLALAERDALVAEQSRAEYAGVDLASRLFASRGARLRADVAGVGVLDAVLRGAGEGWCLLGVGRHSWVVATASVRSVRGLADRGRTAPARPVTARLGLGSVLRGVADDHGEVALHRVDGEVLVGLLGRVGGDFVELRPVADPPAGPGGYVDLVPFAALAAVRCG
jgi:hypothetical protein